MTPFELILSALSLFFAGTTGFYWSRARRLDKPDYTPKLRASLRMLVNMAARIEQKHLPLGSQDVLEDARHALAKTGP